MRWPFVTRALFDEVKRQRDEALRELHRWQDIIAKQNWGEQIHDTLAHATPSEPAQEKPLTEAQATEEELQNEYQQDKAKLASIARTRKSQLPAAMERMMANRLIQRAKKAVASPDIKAHFERLKAETLKSIQ